MATQKMGKMKKYGMSESKAHERSESKSYERAEEKSVKMHFAKEGSEHIPNDRKKYFTVGKHAVDHRDTELYAAGK